ncbi:hypothetical protein SAZ11_08700 [Streptomyces sp. FXJ1.4098]|nr:hypothetical protein [Streptomyces sp. FXJ1.4098]
MSAKLTTEEFVSRAVQVHGDRYDYSRAEYVNKGQGVEIICRVHGSFWQTPHNHVRQKSGCMRCSGNHQATTEEWISRARSVHGDVYDYSRVDYKDAKTKVVIVCSEHGEFEQSPSNHVSQKQGCRKCVGLHSPSTEEWIKRARAVHGDKFGYDSVVYLNNHTKVAIQCAAHGYFEQTPKSHAALKQGCPRCAGKGITTSEWVECAQAVHGDRYDYSQVELRRTDEPVAIICSVHGAFDQTPHDHVGGGCGCPKCACRGRLTYANDDWINRSRAVHGDLYDYSELNYAGQDVKCRVICATHGTFHVTMSNHIYNRSGCPLCFGSKGERLVARVLDDLGVSYSPEWSHPTCRSSQPLLFDFYLPSFEALIEFDGIQHFKPVKWCDSMTDEQAEAMYLATQRRDQIKNGWAAFNGYPLLRVSELKRAGAQVSDFVEGLRERSIEMPGMNNDEDGELG